jgi:hypothetical protein
MQRRWRGKMARKANPIANAPRARVPTRAGHSRFGLRCGKRSSGWRREVQANLSAIEGVANICSSGSPDTLLCALQNKDEYTKSPRNNTHKQTWEKLINCRLPRSGPAVTGPGDSPPEDSLGWENKPPFVVNDGYADLFCCCFKEGWSSDDVSTLREPVRGREGGW